MQTPAQLLVAKFDRYLEGVRGAAPQTRREYVRYALEFLEDRYGTGRVDLADLGARDLIDFIAGRARRCKPATAKLVATALRGFLRFLQIRGLCDPRLVAAVPTIPNWKLARLPKFLTSSQLRALFNAFDRRTATGRRDYAMSLCLAQLGLRAAEVARLALEDIDWRTGTLRIVVGKSRRDSLLPLPDLVGRAIADYARAGRPATQARRVFVRHRVAIGQPLTSGSVRAVVRRAFERGDPRVPFKGTHALRHTAATRMLRAGASLKDLADVLRHRSLEHDRDLREGRSASPRCGCPTVAAAAMKATLVSRVAEYLAMRRGLGFALAVEGAQLLRTGSRRRRGGAPFGRRPSLREASLAVRFTNPGAA